MVRISKLERLRPSRIGSLVGTIIGTREVPIDSFLQQHLPNGMYLVPQSLGTKLYESFYGHVPMEAYYWDQKELAKTKPGKAVLALIDKEGLVPSSLAWEYIRDPGSVTIIGAEILPDGFLRAKGTYHLIGDPLRIRKPTKVTDILRQTKNQIGVPLDILIRIRELGFQREEDIPADNQVQIVQHIPETEDWVSVIVPTWADARYVGDWATHPRFPKDDLGIFLYAAGITKLKGPSETIGRILEMCVTDKTAIQVFKRNHPIQTAETVAATPITELVKKTVPEDITTATIDELIKRSPSSWNYPRGSRNRISTVWTLGAECSDWIVALPPAYWWEDTEKAWYLYRIATTARKGILLLEEGNAGSSF